MLPVIVEKSAALLDAEAAALASRDLESGEVVFELASGLWDGIVSGRVSSEHSLSSVLFEGAETVVSNDVGSLQDLAFPAIAEVTPAVCGAPLIAEDHVVGALWVGRTSPLGDGERSVGLRALRPSPYH